ncbi:amino acid transporter [Brucella anthropi]|uniref:Amino acid transporter n=2 Tax=Brucella anthropi TaxID=529 RepID=A0A6I0DYW8_BRUAN|nr:amino acid transporter [Brucella anthropi]
MLYEHQKPWKPLNPTEVATVFQEATFPWWIAGGHAIEHFVGRPVRAHADINILALRKDASKLRCYLSFWDCWVADPPGHLRSWRAGEVLDGDIHDVWCRQDQCSEWAFQIMLDDSIDLEWQSRCCSQVKKPLTELGVANGQGTLFLAPEIQLFYKAKSPRTKDNLDFEVSLPLLTPEQRAWLTQSIEAAYGPDNIWAEKLRTF